MNSDVFDPEKCTQKQMDRLADNIEAWINLMEKTMIIPDEILDEYGPSIKEGMKRTRKLITKLRKGDRSVFIEESEYDFVDY